MYTIIPIIISAFALAVSIISLIENIKSRKKQAKTKMLETLLQQSQNALDALIPNHAKTQYELSIFDKFVAIKYVLAKNLLYLDIEEIIPLRSQFEELEVEFNKVSGTNLKTPSQDFSCTARLYNITNTREKIEDLYNSLVILAQNRQNELISKISAENK